MRYEIFGRQASNVHSAPLERGMTGQRREQRHAHTINISRVYPCAPDSGEPNVNFAPNGSVTSAVRPYGMSAGSSL